MVKWRRNFSSCRCSPTQVGKFDMHMQMCFEVNINPIHCENFWMILVNKRAELRDMPVFNYWEITSQRFGCGNLKINNGLFYASVIPSTWVLA